MKSKFNLALIGALTFGILVGCSSKPKLRGHTKADDPYGKLMRKKQALIKKGVLAEVGVAESVNLQTGLNKVELEIRSKLARALETRIADLQKQFKEEVEKEYVEHFSQVSKSVSHQLLNGSTLWESYYLQEDDGEYRIFALMVVDSKVYLDALEAGMQAQAAMKTRWLASKAYRELEQEADAFDQWKKNQNSSLKSYSESK